MNANELIKKISYYKTNEDVITVERMISMKRLKALKSKGNVRCILHQEANELESDLQNALAAFEYRRANKSIEVWHN